MNPTTTDRQVLLAMDFNAEGKFYTAGNMNRRKFERLEAIGWVKGVSTNLSDVVYYLTDVGRQAYQIKRGDVFKVPQDGREQLLTVTEGHGETLIMESRTGQRYQFMAGDVRHLLVNEAPLG